MKKAIKYKFLINLVSFLSSTTISFSQAAYIPPVVGSSGYNYISASSTMLPDLGYNFVPKNIDDNSLYTWWSPLREDNSTCWIKWWNLLDISKITNIQTNSHRND